LLAVSLAVSLTEKQGPMLSTSLGVAFLLVALVFVWRSFYGMRIERAKA
jgi:K(+)-stimulated pyrophosphate-energized sodium pump